MEPLVSGRFEVRPDGSPRLLATRCSGCERFVFPAREICTRCKRPTMVRVGVGGGARLYSFTICHVAPAGWQAPYLQAYVELPEGIRLFTLISDEVEPRADALEVGMAMELVLEPVLPGSAKTTYKFRPGDQCPEH